MLNFYEDIDNIFSSFCRLVAVSLFFYGDEESNEGVFVTLTTHKALATYNNCELTNHNILVWPVLHAASLTKYDTAIVCVCLGTCVSVCQAGFTYAPSPSINSTMFRKAHNKDDVST